MDNITKTLKPGRRIADAVWVFLILLTLVSAWIAEHSIEPGLGISLFVAMTIAVKGRLILDHFMELTYANRRIRGLMNFYFYFIPALVLLTYWLGEPIAKLTSFK